MKKLKIAIFCTNEWPTPPPENIFYAPLWIAYWIAEGLAQRGHKVFYFGAKGSRLKYAKLISLEMKAIRENQEILSFAKESPLMNEKVVNFYEQWMISKIYQIDQKEKFDIIHIHPFKRCLVFAPLTKTPTVITIHDPIADWYKHLLSFTKKIPSVYLISISDKQRSPLPDLNYVATIYNGIDLKRFPFNKNPNDYFAAAGRFVPAKGIDLAIKIAKRAKIKLKIAGGPAKGEYWEKRIKPHLNKDIEYVGMLEYSKMGEFYGKARALLAPIRWEEPFGLYFIEAMATGTPVIAFKRGAAEEIVRNGKTGFLVRDEKEMISAIKKINQIKRKECRRWVEENFRIERMVDDYERTFYKIVQKTKK